MIDFTLNDQELETIKRAMRQADEAEVRQRATAIHLLHQGHTPEQVGEMCAVTAASI